MDHVINMGLNRKILVCRRGVETIFGAVLVLLLLFTILTSIFLIYSNFNDSAQTKFQTDHARSQEKIAIIDLEIDYTDNDKITDIIIQNIGSIEVKIRALYREEDGLTTFLTDPSTYMDTHVAPSANLTVDVQSLGLILSNATLSAATERGLKSVGVNEIDLEFGEPNTYQDTSMLYVGPLALSFDSLEWATVNNQGDPTGSWVPNYNIPSGEKIAWRINVTNLDTEKRNIIINNKSGFTASKVDSPSTQSWYLKPTSLTLNWNQSSSIIFVWDTFSATKVSAVSASQEGVNNVFLTFFGIYSDSTAYAQTIPFEAITIVK